jgi:hypothetical protein
MDMQIVLLTFSTYGSRLHGDERGSWQRNVSALPRNDMLRGYERSQLTQPPVVISAEMRPVIELGVIEACIRRDWPLLALNVRTEHVHAVLVSNEAAAALAATKAYPTRRLSEEGLTPQGGKVWARGGSTGVLRTEESVCRAIDYVLNRQGATLAGSIFMA